MQFPATIRICLQYFLWYSLSFWRVYSVTSRNDKCTKCNQKNKEKKQKEENIPPCWRHYDEVTILQYICNRQRNKHVGSLRHIKIIVLSCVLLHLNSVQYTWYIHRYSICATHLLCMYYSATQYLLHMCCAFVTYLYLFVWLPLFFASTNLLVSVYSDPSRICLFFALFDS